MSSGVGSVNPCIGQNAKETSVRDASVSTSPVCGPKENLRPCILCSRTHNTTPATDGEHGKNSGDMFGPETAWDNLPPDMLCPSDAIFSDDIDLSSALRDGTFPKELLSFADDCGSPLCVCERYSSWKALDPEADQQELLCWQVVKQALHRKYQRAGLDLGGGAAAGGGPLRQSEQQPQPPSDAEVRAMVSRLRRRDPQHLLQCLKYQAQLFVVESRLRMLRQLVAGPRLEDALVAEYAKLRLAWEELDPLLEELQVLPAHWMPPSWKSGDPDAAKNTGQCCRSLTAREPPPEGCNSGAPEQRQCCLAATPGMVCPFAEARPSVLAAGGEPSSTAPLASSSPPVLPGATWGHGGDTCGPGPNGQQLPEASPPKKTAETCECHSCAQMQWNPQSLLQLYNGRPISLELDSLDSLNQFRDWEDDHVKSRHTSAELSPQPAPPGTASPQSSPTPALRHSDAGTCVDSDCDNILLDGEESMDETCSEHSSSTTASNQRSAGESRVCDCCYCEVFGHGTPAMAPVSKNYQEMRDRLRMVLSKRKAEGGGGTSKQRQQNHHDQKAHGDAREVDELISYINGTDGEGGRKESSDSPAEASGTATGTVSKRHKRKTKRREELDKSKDTVEHKPNNGSVNSRLVEEETEQRKAPSSPKTVVNSNEARKENGIRLSKSPKSNGATVNGNSCVASIRELNEEDCPQQMSSCKRMGTRAAPSKLSDSRMPTTSISGNVFIIGRPSSPSETDSVLDEATLSKMNLGDVELSVKASTLASSNVRKQQPQDRQAGVPQAAARCNHQQTSATHQLATAKKQLCTNHLNGTQAAASKGKKSKKKKASSAEVISPDEVFMPKDNIDLENGDMDELEREVEAFKRFCFNSVPVANKEKVNVNLKDILVRKKQSSASVMTTGVMQRS